LILCILLLFSFLSIFSFPNIVKAGTQTFGYTASGGTLQSLANRITGSVFTANLNGTAQSITVYLYNNIGSTQNVKCAIYNASDLSLVGETDEEGVATGTAWHTFEFSSSPNVTAGEQYVLVAWSAYAQMYIGYDAGSTNQGYYDSETYNGFPDPMVPSYENREYSIYCTVEEFHDYNYYFYGLYDEDTGYLEAVADRAINVTAYWDDGTSSETFEVNGSSYQAFDTTPQYFFFELGSVDREYWLSAEEGNASTVNIYIFTDSLTSYTITFLDWVGALSTYSWVSASRYINGTETVVDKRKVDEQKKVVMGLQSGKTYVIKVEAEAGTTYTWGELTVTSDTTIELSIKGLEFPQDVILTYRYVRAYGYRTSNNSTYDSIVHLYEDTKLNTDSVNVSIYNSSDILIHSYLYEDTDSFSYTWNNALHNESYFSRVTIDHGDYGILEFRQSYARGFSDPPFALDFLGSLPGDISTSTLFPMGMLLVLTLIFSALTAGFGGIMVVVFASVFTYWGWISFDVNTLVFVGVLAVLYAVMKNYKRVTVR